MDIHKILGCRYLGGSVPLETQHGLVRRHPAAVIYHLHQRTAGIGYDDSYIVRPGIDGILHKLLDNRRWSLDHLPCSDDICYT